VAVTEAFLDCDVVNLQSEGGTSQWVCGGPARIRTGDRQVSLDRGYEPAALSVRCCETWLSYGPSNGRAMISSFNVWWKVAKRNPVVRER